MSRFEKNFDNYDRLSDWYSYAAGMEFVATWGQLPQFKADIHHLEFMHVQTCWLESALDDMQARRRAVESLARSVLSPTDVPDEELKKWWPLFGVESVSGKLADAICTLYNDAPFREFSADEGVNQAFGQIYETFEVNHTMKDAYRASLFTNLVAILPDWEEKKIRVLTPDYFRIFGDELWIAKGYGGYANKEFEVWTKETVSIVDHGGKSVKRETNPYGRIPAVMLKLNRSNDIYGSGISEAAELGAWSNFIRLISTRVAVFQSYSVGFAQNFDILPGTRMGPGYIMSGKNPGGEPGSIPDFKYVNPSPQFVQLEEYRQSVIRQFEKNHGLPSFLVDDAGTPPTGAALQVMERQLNDKRKEHTYALIKAEKDLCSLIAQQAKMFAGRDLNPEAFGIQYSDVETFNNAGDELDYDVIRMGQGLVSPSALVLKYFNQRMTDEAAAAFIANNKKYFPGAAQPEVSVAKETV
jgi:hypothetical protein